MSDGDPWLARPPVQLVGKQQNRLSIITDGKTSRFKEKPVPGGQHRGQGYPDMGRNSPWCQQLPVALMEGQVLIADGAQAWIKEKPAPQEGDRQIIEEQAPFEFTPCSPPVFNLPAILKDPDDGTLQSGVEYTFTASIASGTTPITLKWYLNGVLVFTGDTFVHTIVNGDIQDPDETGLGFVGLYVVASNACGEDSTDTEGGFPGQTV